MMWFRVTKLQTTWSARSVRGWGSVQTRNMKMLDVSLMAFRNRNKTCSNFRGTHKIFSYAWLLLVQVAFQQCFWKLTTALFISYQVSFDQQRGHINTLDSFGNAEINNHASLRASPVDAIEIVVKLMWTSGLSHTKKYVVKISVDVSPLFSEHKNYKA